MKTKKEILLEFIKEYSNQYQMEEYPQLTTLFLSEKLNMQWTNISTLLNQLVKEGKVKKIDGRPVLYQLVFNENEKRDFESLIGHDQSLKEAIMLAKAAILSTVRRSTIELHPHFYFQERYLNLPQL